jgi:hypothetical protein
MFESIARREKEYFFGVVNGKKFSPHVIRGIVRHVLYLTTLSIVRLFKLCGG